MGTFGEIAVADYRLSFADQGNQTSVIRLQQTNESLPFPFAANQRKLPFSTYTVQILKRQHRDGHVCRKAIVDYRLSFADQGKQTLVFRLQQTRS